MTKGDKLAKQYHEHSNLSKDEKQYLYECGIPLNDAEIAGLWRKAGAVIKVKNVKDVRCGI